MQKVNVHYSSLPLTSVESLEKCVFLFWLGGGGVVRVYVNMGGVGWGMPLSRYQLFILVHVYRNKEMVVINTSLVY